MTQKKNIELSFMICEKQIWHILEIIYQNTENTAKIQNLHIKLVICQSTRKSISKATQHNATFKI